MLRHFILGLLRDSSPRHGYEVITSYRTRTGEELSPGNVYRELSRLVDEGLLEPGRSAAGQDTRRIPYRITHRGEDEFDQWFSSSRSLHEDLPTWIIFIDRMPAEVVLSMIDRRQQELLLQGQVVATARDDSLERLGRTEERGCYHPLPLLLSRRMKQIAAEAEFLEEARQHLKLRGPIVLETGQETRASELSPRGRRGRGSPARSTISRR